MPRNFRYWGFISYSHDDAPIARRLHAALEGYRIPRRLVGLDGPFGPVPQRLQPMFRDRDELDAGGQLGPRVRAALEVSRSLIVVCSASAAQSRWVDAEAMAFQQLHPDGPLFCVILGDAAAPLAQHVPKALQARFAQGAAMAETAPVAVDLRVGGDSWRHGVHKIVAGLTGLPLDQLVQRDAHRRHVRLAWLAAVLAATACALGILAFAASRSRNEARFQRAQAEGLIEFMLVDLRKRLEPAGRLDVLDAVGARALRYYDGQSPRSLDPDSLGRRARALHLIGEISDRRGDTREARAAFASARRSTAELLARFPDDPQRLYDHAQSVFWNGYVDWQYGDLANAGRAFEEYGRLATRLSARDPSNPDWLAEVGFAHSNLGTLLMEQGRAAEAIPEFLKSLEINRRRARLPGDPVATQLDIGQDRSWLSSAYYAHRQLRPAIAEREAELAIYARLSSVAPDNALVGEREMLARRFNGEMYLAAGDLDRAGSELQRSIALSDAQARLDSANTTWRKSAVMAHVLSARLARRTGNVALAQEQLEKAAQLVRQQLQKDPEATDWRIDLDEAVASEMAALQIQAGRLDEVDAALLVSQQRLREVMPQTSTTLRYRLANFAMQARVAELRQRSQAAHALWRELAVLAEAEHAHLDGASLLLLRDALRATGRASEADRLSQSLVMAGFQVDSPHVPTPAGETE